MRIGYSTWSMFTVPYHLFIPRLHDIGFTAIGLNVNAGSGRLPNANDLARLTKDDAQRIKAECEQRDLLLESVAGHTSVLGDDPAQVKAQLRRLRDTIDF